MLVWQFILYAFVTVPLGALMTIVATILSMVIIGRSEHQVYFGRFATLEHYTSIRWLLICSAKYSYLILLLVLLVLQVPHPLDLFDGYLPALWLALTLVAAALIVLEMVMAPAAARPGASPP